MDETTPLLREANGRTLRRRAYEVLEQKNAVGRYLNYSIFVLIIVNVLAFILSTDASVAVHFGHAFDVLEAASVVIFTVEYLLRLWASKEDGEYAMGYGRLRYFCSFFALVDLAAILPFYLDLMMPETDLVPSQFVRILRLLRLLKVGGCGYMRGEGGWVGVCIHDITLLGACVWLPEIILPACTN